jgi:hypothetical protein
LKNHLSFAEGLEAQLRFEAMINRQLNRAIAELGEMQEA